MASLTSQHRQGITHRARFDFWPKCAQFPRIDLQSTNQLIKYYKILNCLQYQNLVADYIFIVGADSLCSRLTEKITSNHGQRLVLAHMPLLMVCLEGLGKLAQKFPNIASTSIICLRDFLVTPSPILLKLHKHNSDKNTTGRDNLLITGMI